MGSIAVGKNLDHSARVREFIVETFLFGDGDDLRDDTSFLESGLIDSTGILELVEFIEQTYLIKIKDEELVPGNLDSLEKIARFSERKLQADSVGGNETPATS
ncbi:MAG: acyl carrier protein [Kiritimatiellales bacterium]|nr:acyl carrier protein [Kiritimatiellales bacterium]